MDELDSFLKEGTPTDTAAEKPAEAPAEKPAAETPPTEAKAPEKPAEPAAKASTKEPEPEEDDHALPVTGGDNRTVPFSALEKVRNDWKSKYAAEQARAELLAKQLEEAKRPPPAPAAPVQQLPPPDFNTNPTGYLQHLVQQNQKQILNERLNLSEAILREKIGSEKVDQYVADFRSLAERDATLWDKLYSQPTPYQWLAKEMDKLRLRSEIGDDPAAFEAKVRAKVEAELLAKGNGAGNVATAQGPGLPAQPPSLATARSVAGRTSAAFTGAPSLDQIFARPERRAR